MLSIDDAIAHAKEVAKRNRTLLDSDELVQKSYDGHFDKLKCEKCAEEHEQLADWLEELKANKVASAEVYEQGYKRGYKDGYNKAIDDFANWLVEQGILGNRCISDGEITDYGKVYAKKYKEQLKAGGKNEID